MLIELNIVYVNVSSRSWSWRVLIKLTLILAKYRGKYLVEIV